MKGGGVEVWEYGCVEVWRLKAEGTAGSEACGGMEVWMCGMDG